MTIHGEYILESGLVIPNQFTTAGMLAVVKSCFWGIKNVWYMGLCARNPDDVVTMDSLLEPTVAVNGYGRQPVPLNVANWAKIGIVNGETFVESRPITFTPIGGVFDQQVNRLFITDGDNVLSISSALPGGLAEIGAPMMTRYRLFFR